MNITLINSLVEKYCELSGHKLNHFSFHTDKGRYESKNEASLQSFFDEVYDAGNYANIIFTNNGINLLSFNNLIADLTYPIVVLLKKDVIYPAILYKENRKLYKITFGDERIFSNQEVEIEQVIEELHTYGSLKERFDFKYDRGDKISNDKSLNDVFFMTGIPVEMPTKDNDGHLVHLSPFQRLLKLLTTERKEIRYIYFFAVLVGIVNLALPLGIQSIITLISGGTMMSSMIVLTLIIVGATAFSGYLQILQLSFVEVLQQRVFAKAAYEFSFRIPKIKLEAISKEYGPELVNRFFDVLNIQKSLPKFLIDITAAVLQIFFGLILLSFYHPIFIFFGIVLIALILVIIRLTGKKGLDSSIKESKFKYKVAYWLEELARNANTFKLAGFTNLTIDKTDKYLYNYLIARQKHFKVLKTQYISIVIFKTFITAALLIMGGLLVFQNQINIGQFIAAELIIVLIITAVEKLIATLDVIYDLLTALDKVGHVTDLPLENSQGISLDVIPDAENFMIEFKDLSYAYAGSTKKVLHDVSFTLKAGEKICIAGQNSVGKTTLIKIITGLYYDYEGTFSFNNIPLKDINIFGYRDMIGENISHAEIFEGTIEENITVGKKGITLENLMWAIEKVGLSEFLKSQPEGLRTQMVAGGNDLASNIRQKFILARSLAEKPQLLVMDDEFFTAPDEKRQILDVLFNKDSDWSLVLVTNDPVLHMKADKVVFLQKDKKAEVGKFTVMKSNKEYFKLIDEVY